MELIDLKINKAAGPGRRAVPVNFSIVRDIEESDLTALSEVDAGSKTPALKRLSDRHHSLARLLASGTSEGDAALILGYDPSRVSTLKSSPAFQELLSLYRGEVDRQYSTTLEHMAGLSRDALIELRDRIEESPEDFSHRELLAISTELNDRAERGGDTTRHLPTTIELVPHVAEGTEDDDSAA